MNIVEGKGSAEVLYAAGHERPELTLSHGVR